MRRDECLHWRRPDRRPRDPRGQLGLASHATAVPVGAEQAPGDARAGRGFLAATSRPDDLLFGYEPLFLGAWERNHVVPGRRPAARDSVLALQTLSGSRSRSAAVSGSSTRASANNLRPRLEIENRDPGPARALRDARLRPIPRPPDARARARRRDAYLAAAARAMLVGRSLGIGDADVNLQTIELRRPRATRLRAVAAPAIRHLAVARARSRTPEPGRGLAPFRAGAQPAGGGRGRAPISPPITSERTSRPGRHEPLPLAARHLPPILDRRGMRSPWEDPRRADLLPRRPRARRDRAPRAAARAERGRDVAHRAAARWPGGQRRGVDRSARWELALRRQARRRRRRAIAAARLAASASTPRPGRAARERRHRLTRRPVGRADDVPRPRRRASSSAPEEVDAAWFEDCEPSPRLRLRAAARAGSLCRLARDRAARAQRGAAVSIDLSSWSAIRDFGGARFRSELEELAPDVVFANEDEDEIVGGPIAGCTWILKRGARGRLVRRGRACSRCRSTTSSTRRARAMPSRPAGSSAGRSSRSRPAHAACSSRDRCRRAATPEPFI